LGKTLIITEKPSVAREYARILNVSGKGDGVIENNEYCITWCVGHLVEMLYPEAYDIRLKKWNLNDLPFLPETYKYDIIPNVKKQYETVKRCLHRTDIDLLLWAGDSGREGQVIEELIRMQSGVEKTIEEKRVWIDSTTEEEILRGIREAKPYESYRNLANAGIMRGIEDYAMGINFSRALSVKYGRMLNDRAGTKKYTAIAVGRVMTCVLGMVVKREREIRDFKETPFYRIEGSFEKEGISFTGQWKALKGSEYFESPLLYNEKGFKEKKDALKLIDELKEFGSALCFKADISSESKKPPLLFNLAELQAECSKRFKISPDETLQAAQTLYESKLTTYPRTDARVLSSAVAKEITKNLSGLYKYPPAKDFVQRIRDEGLYKDLEKTRYVDDKKITDHYAIIPTGNLSMYGKLSDLQKKVYDLIVRRFLSIFYPPAVYEKAALILQVGKEKFYTNVKALKDPGYFEVAGLPKGSKDKGQDKEAGGDEASSGNEETGSSDEKGNEDEDIDNGELLDLIKKLHKGDIIKVLSFDTKEGKTSPPKRYTSGSMVLAMENAGQLIEDEELRAQIRGAGIGTSATRAGIIEKLIKVGYLSLNKKTQVLTPKKLGEMIYEVVRMTLPAMLEPKMTASWEKGLSGVESGEISPEEYRATLDKYVTKYVNTIKARDISNQIGPNLAHIAAVNKK